MSGLDPPADAPPEGMGRDPFLGRVVADKYELRHLIAVGGMGRVYGAIQRPLGRRVAVKILKPKNAEPGVLAAFKKRFLREAATYARLQHASIVNLFDYGQLEDNEDTLFMVMEFVRGQTLKQLLRENAPLPVPRALHIAYHIGLSLREAHRAGVVHRDLKPSNVMVATQRGRDQVKVLDFGLAKILDPETSGSITLSEAFQKVADDQQSLSQAGEIIGSPGHMAPEQIRGEPVDRRSDIYCLGIMMYEMLIGQPPFKGINAIETLMQHLNAPLPPFYDVTPELLIPDEIEALVRTCLAKDPDQRFQNVDALLKAIRIAVPPGGLGEDLTFTEDTATPAPAAPAVASAPPEPTSKRLLYLAVAAAVIAAIAGVAVAKGTLPHFSDAQQPPDPLAEPSPAPALKAP